MKLNIVRHASIEKRDIMQYYIITLIYDNSFL